MKVFRNTFSNTLKAVTKDDATPSNQSTTQILLGICVHMQALKRCGTAFIDHISMKQSAGQLLRDGGVVPPQDVSLYNAASSCVVQGF